MQYLASLTLTYLLKIIHTQLYDSSHGEFEKRLFKVRNKSILKRFAICYGFTVYIHLIVCPQSRFCKSELKITNNKRFFSFFKIFSKYYIDLWHPKQSWVTCNCNRIFSPDFFAKYHRISSTINMTLLHRSFSLIM